MNNQIKPIGYIKHTWMSGHNSSTKKCTRCNVVQKQLSNGSRVFYNENNMVIENKGCKK